ncbi:MAG: hypothetical protein EON55_13970, partial [Alphaproteobacteria bacterium]
MATNSMTPTGLLALSAVGGVAAFAACGLSLALLGLGLPYLLCAAISGACAGLLIYALGRWGKPARTVSAPPEALPELLPGPLPEPAPVDPAIQRLAELEREMSLLRHELRGALSPALMVSDRLLRSEDPLIRRAGDAVVRSVDRATALIGGTDD